MKLGISANVPVPVSVAFIGWILDNTEVSDDPRITPVLDELPTAVWFAFGNDLGKYIGQVHAYDAKRAHKTIIFVIVNSVAEALLAANEWKVDVLVVQGIPRLSPRYVSSTSDIRLQVSNPVAMAEPRLHRCPVYSKQC